MNISSLVEIFTQEFSAQAIMDSISQISQYHRIQGSLGFLEAARNIESVLRESGISSEIHYYPADGKWNSWGWISPISWNIKSGECWLLEPVKKRLCRFKDQPMSVVTHSKPIDFEGTLVDVGTGEKPSDYEIASGKIALITASPRRILSYAAKQNVKGLLLHPNLDRAAQIGDSTVQYDGFWPIAENLAEVTSGFSLSHAQARELQKYLKGENEVKVHFKIDAEFLVEKGKLNVLESAIIGKEKPLEEIVMIAHLCHPSPGANDNASGSATLQEVVLSLNRMIKTRQIEAPKRTIRFLWVPEFAGTIPWLAEYDQERKTNGRRIKSVINLDMVGESPKTVGTPLNISSPSLTTPSFLIGMIKHVSELVRKHKVSKNGWTYHLNYSLQPFAGGSDHFIFNDNYFSIPGVMFGHEDPYHHSSADSIDKVEPLECKSVGVISSIVAYVISTQNPLFLHEILPSVLSEIINDSTKLQHTSNYFRGLSPSLQRRQIELVAKIMIEKVKSVLELNEDNNLQEEVDHYVKMVEKQLNHLNHPHESPQDNVNHVNNTDKRVFKRNYPGPLPFKRLMSQDRSMETQLKFGAIIQQHWGGIVLELLNMVDGIMNVEDIYLLLKFSYPNLKFNDITFIINLFIDEKILIEE